MLIYGILRKGLKQPILNKRIKKAKDNFKNSIKNTNVEFHSKQEIKTFAEENDITFEECLKYILTIFIYDVKEIKEILEKQNGCWYGKKKIGCSTEFIQKYVNRITNISRAIAVKLCNNYKIASKIDDYASDTFLYIIEKCGDLEKNHEDDEDTLFRKITLRAKLAMKGKIILDNFVIRETRTCYNTDKYGNLEVKDDKSDVENEPNFAEIWQEVKQDIENKTIVCHNAAFDTAVLRKCLEFYNISFPDFNYICTVKVSQKLWPDLENHKLDTVSSFLFI